GIAPRRAHARTVSGETRSRFASSRAVTSSVACSIEDTPGGAGHWARPYTPGAYLSITLDTHRYPLIPACFHADTGAAIILRRRRLWPSAAPAPGDGAPSRPFVGLVPPPPGSASGQGLGFQLWAAPLLRQPPGRSHRRATSRVGFAPILGVG